MTKKELIHVVIPEGEHYNNAGTLYTVSWDKVTNTFSIIFADNYWDYYKSKSEREAAIWQKTHIEELLYRLTSIIKTGDWPA